MNILITGRNGFIGSHLYDLLRSNKDVNIAHIPHESLFDKKFMQSLHNIHFDYIFHLAAYGNMHHQTDTTEMQKANAMGTLNLIKALRETYYKGFVYASTSSVYGVTDKPMVESMEPHPTTMYAATKLMGEEACKLSSEMFREPIVIARLFTVYGEGEANYRFIPTVCNALKTNQPFPLEPKPTHTYIHVDDVCKALAQLSVSIDREKLKGKVVNIGSRDEVSNLDIVQMLERISGKKANYRIQKDLREGHSKRWICDTTFAESISIRPYVTLQEGLERVYAST